MTDHTTKILPYTVVESSPWPLQYPVDVLQKLPNANDYPSEYLQIANPIDPDFTLWLSQDENKLPEVPIVSISLFHRKVLWNVTKDGGIYATCYWEKIK